MSKNPVKQLLLSSNFWVLNKPLVYKLGLETAFLLSNFAEAEYMSKDGWFYQTIETVERMTTLSRHKQDKSIKKLTGLGILESDVRGMPAKRYFRIDYCKLSAILFEDNSHTSLLKSRKLDCEESTTNKELNKELSNKELNNKDSASGDVTSTTNKDIENNFESMWKIYPNKRNKGQVSPSKKKEIYRVGEEFKRCIERYVDDVEYQRKNGFPELKYKVGSTFFNSGYIDYLDGNYESIIEERKEGLDGGLKGASGTIGEGGYSKSKYGDLSDLY